MLREWPLLSMMNLERVDEHLKLSGAGLDDGRDEAVHSCEVGESFVFKNRPLNVAKTRTWC